MYIKDELVFLFTQALVEMKCILLASCLFYRPLKPEEMDWSEHYPDFYQSGQTILSNCHKVEFADIGCGYGGLLGKAIIS